MKKGLFLTIFLIFSICLTAQEQNEEKSSKIEQNTYLSIALAVYPPNHKGYNSDGFAPVDFETIEAKHFEDEYGINEDQARDIGGTGLELKSTISHEVKIPFLQGSGPLTRGNNILAKFKGELSPVSINGICDLTFTPIAFIKFNTGLSVGTGWTTAGIVGLGENSYKDDEVKSKPLSGYVSRTWAGATFQFDLAAVIPGDWTHIVFVANQKIEHKSYSAAEDDQPWTYEADRGENFNGFKWHQTYFFGYQMPKKPFYIDTAGFLLETNQRITNKDGVDEIDGVEIENDWGADLITYNFGPLINFKFTEDSWFTFLVQFKTAPNYTDETVGYAHFMKREIDEDDPQYLYFSRVALVAGMKL